MRPQWRATPCGGAGTAAGELDAGAGEPDGRSMWSELPSSHWTGADTAGAGDGNRWDLMRFMSCCMLYVVCFFWVLLFKKNPEIPERE